MVRYAKMGSIQLGPVPIWSISMRSGLGTLGSDRNSIRVPVRSVSEDDAKRAKRSASVFASLGIWVMDSPFRLAEISRTRDK